jgi:hypothetical protein
MKKTYTTPTLVASGDVVDETRNGQMEVDEIGFPATKTSLPGSIGYYL